MQPRLKDAKMQDILHYVTFYIFINYYLVNQKKGFPCKLMTI